MHPNVKVVALFDENVTGWKGAHQAYQVREFQDQGLVFASINVPPSLMAMSLPHRGRALGDLMHQYDHMMLAGMLCEDTGTGRVRTINGKPQAFYQLNAHDAHNLKRGVSLLSELLFAAGARQIMLPFHGAADLYSPDDARRLLDQDIPPGGSEVLTVHMMGTAAMGTDRTTSVTNQFGLVHDTDRLMVVDASLFPTPIGVNPMETIMALATRCAGHVIDNAGRLLSCPQQFTSHPRRRLVALRHASIRAPPCPRWRRSGSSRHRCASSRRSSSAARRRISTRSSAGSSAASTTCRSTRCRSPRSRASRSS
jgi:hypothetical protein